MAENFNISPDMIENLVNMLNNSNKNTSINKDDNSNITAEKNNLNSTSNSNKKQNNFDFSFNQNDNNNINTQNTNNSNNTINFGNLDFETIMKIKSIMETLNTSNDQDSNLLYSLKPYLRKSRQVKLDQYINILKISQVSKLFKKGDVN